MIMVLALGAGCGKGANDAGSVPPPPAPLPAGAVAIDQTPFSPTLNVDLAASTKTASGLYYRDVVVGTGQEVVAGTRVGVLYAGALPTGEPFDQRVQGEEPFSFTVGAGQVVAGWEEGVVGMRVGGKRQLIVPYTLGYGTNGRGPIPPFATMVFTVDVVSAQ